MRSNTTNRRLQAALLAACASVALVPTAAQAQQASAQVTYDIPAKDLGTALTDLARQSKREIYFDADLTRGKRAPRLSGAMTVEQALAKLLKGTGLTFRTTSSGSIVVEAGNAVAPDSGSSSGEPSNQSAISEILVIGKHSQNVDIRRTEDDPQPYIVFEAKQIQESGATDLDDFFRARVPANAPSELFSRTAFPNGNPLRATTSQINLRGLLDNQTLILIDGRRAPIRSPDGSDFLQADVSSIPIGSIERIEILPASAGAIYGGGAVGGVVNIIRKRNYNSLQMRAGFDGTFQGGAERYHFDVNGGLSLEGGRTQLAFSASYSDGNPLYARQRDLTIRSRELLIASPSYSNEFSGSTANIRSLDGTPLVLRDGTQLGAAFTYLPAGYEGPAFDGGAGLVANAGKWNLDLSDDAAGRRAILYTNPQRYSANLNVRREFNKDISGYLDVAYYRSNASSNAPASGNTQVLLANDPGNPFIQNVRVVLPVPQITSETKSESESIIFTAGVIAKLFGNWSGTAEYTWNRAAALTIASQFPVDTTRLSQAVRNGTVDIFADGVDISQYLNPEPDVRIGPIRTSQEILSVRAGGSVLSLPAGDLSANLLFEQTSDILEEGRTRSTWPAYQSRTFPPRSQRQRTVYAELHVPIIAPENKVPFLRAFELQVSGRIDRYRATSANPSQILLSSADEPLPAFSPITTRYGSTDYLVAARWETSRDLAFRGSISTGFLPPAVSSLITVRGVGPVGFYADPARGGEIIGTRVPYEILGGADPSIEPERSRTLSFGAIFTPQFLSGLRVSADYVDITKTGEIGNLTIDYILANEDTLGDLVMRGPNVAGDSPGTPGPITLIDQRLNNFNKAEVKSIDFRAEYEHAINANIKFDVYGYASRNLNFSKKPFETSIEYDTLGFVDGPGKWRGNVGLNVKVHSISFRWNAQYYSGYSLRYGAPGTDFISNFNVQRNGRDRIPSQMFHDAGLSYEFPRSSPLTGTKIDVNIQNVFNKRPEALAAPLIGYSSYGDPRLRRFSISLSKEF